MKCNKSLIFRMANKRIDAVFGGLSLIGFLLRALFSHLGYLLISGVNL